MSRDPGEEEFLKQLQQVDEKEHDTTSICDLSQAFDRLWSCYALGSQATHYYRYGTKKDCSERTDDFKFCLKLKTMARAKAEKLKEEREAEKLERFYADKNSEDVWTLRKSPPQFTPFNPQP
ncbi:hypothetical protein BZG36_01254 [Bifiguratus adelaidae]|uniref:Early meiotic induction protein 1 n=1 Tax=Bifiguratus adelaidae TaxID=1938954 RepID=A0A261Y642_9FUNG|nr:hypothetical protein BZG36_01254 [Bifiguratus adelaidae]